MPYYREQLLSAWPSHMIFEVGAPPTNVETQLAVQLASPMKPWEHGSHGRSAKPLLRNHIENTRTSEKASTSLQAPKFLSEKARESANDTNVERRISDVADAIGATELLSLKAEVPVMYRNVEIKYSKFGVDDFDFGQVLCGRLFIKANRNQLLQ
jgi:PAB-dependent poly(A)-specific ribonuclease subunit 2